MTATKDLRGVFAAVITPLDSHLRPDPDMAIPYYRELLARGCDGLNVLGTTGEAFSLSVDDRLRFMEAVAGSDLPRERMMVGTGAAALGDAIRLTAAAFRLGFRGALIMPPFFFRDVTDEGVMEFFTLLVDAVHPAQRSVYLYNFPQMSGVRFHPELVERLTKAFPNVIAGMKDSSNDAALQERIIEMHPELAVFPSSEGYLTAARDSGLAGCISGSVALWPQLAADVWKGNAAKQAALGSKRAALAGFPLINCVRSLTAERLNDLAWERCLPPLSPLSGDRVRLLTDMLEAVK
jgi:4-hydroxy-tetrahydrodipicolinate synthase